MLIVLRGAISAPLGSCFGLIHTAFIFYIKAQLLLQPFPARLKYISNQFDDKNIEDNSRAGQKYEEIRV